MCKKNQSPLVVEEGNIVILLPLYDLPTEQPYPMLPAPKIAGLLPAPPEDETVIELPKEAYSTVMAEIDDDVERMAAKIRAKDQTRREKVAAVNTLWQQVRAVVENWDGSQEHVDLGDGHTITAGPLQLDLGHSSQPQRVIRVGFPGHPEDVKRSTILAYLKELKKRPSSPSPVMTRLVYPQRSRQARKDGEAHIAVTGDFRSRNLKRKAGDPLCKPAEKFIDFLDFTPDQVQVCPECMERCRRYQLPVPDGIELSAIKMTRLQPGDPPVKYIAGARWFDYEEFFVFDGELRRWRWVWDNCICAECGADIDSRRVTGRDIYAVEVLGIPFTYYNVCRSPQRHPIRDERDLRRRSMPQKKNDDGASEAYAWVIASRVPEEEDIPF